MEVGSKCYNRSLAGVPNQSQATPELFMGVRYTISDGKLVLNITVAEEGGYVVTSPLDPELITEADTIEEAFANARDAAQALKQARAKLKRRLATGAAQR
jgi:antitoxin HicB